MILKLFRTNQPYVLIFLPLIALVLWVYAFLNPLPPQELFGGPLFDVVYQWSFHLPWLAALISMLSVLIGAVLLNQIFNRHEFTKRANFLPALFYLLSNSFYIGLVGIHPIQLANLFVLLSLRRLLSTYRIPNAFSHIFDAGLLMGIAILFFPPSGIILPLIWSSLVQLRAFNWREWVIPFFGLACTGMFTFAFYFWFDNELHLSEYFALSGYSLPKNMAGTPWLKWIFVLISLFFFAAGLVLFFRDMAVSTVHKKNTKRTFLWASFYLILCFVYCGFLPGQTRTEISLLSIPFSIMSSVFFYSKSRLLLKQLLFWLWLIILLVNFYWLWFYK